MKGLLVIIALCLAGSNALVKKVSRGRIAGPSPQDPPAGPHACIILVERRGDEEGMLRLGGGTIVTRNRVITATHVVFDAINVQVGFYAGVTLRRVDTTDVVQHNDFNTETNAFDLAVLRFVGQPFPALNVIPIIAAEPAVGDVVTIWAFGFTAPDSTLPSQFVHTSDQTVEECVEGEVKFSELTHFCAAAASDILCPGDTGSGVLNADSQLVGVLSAINTGCAEVTPSSFTKISEVLAFLEQQGISPADPADPPPDENPPAEDDDEIV